MRQGLSATLRLFVVVIAVAVYGMNGYRVDAAEAALYPACESFCYEDSECFSLCTVPVGENFQIFTCGTFNGGSENGMCNPDSCDTTCSELTSCGAQCSTGGEATTCGDLELCVACGDDTCVAGVENRTNCAADCGYCGNGKCEIPYEVAGAGYCETDCGPNTPADPPECDPEEQPCGSGSVCVPDHTCQEISLCNTGGLCFENSDCCTETLHEKCYTFPNSQDGIGFCAYSGIPTDGPSLESSRVCPRR